MHYCATQASHISLAALHDPFGPHMFPDNPPERPRLRELARWEKESEKIGTYYEPVVEEASYYIDRILRNLGGKKVARRVEENEESSTDSEPIVEEASHHCSEASKL